MCYMLLLGTDSPTDLSLRNTELLIFSKELPGLPEEQCLELSQKWFVGSAHGCSCGFRHLHVSGVSLGFGGPEDWFPEESADIEATRQFIGVVRSLVSAGYQVECVDAWANDQALASLTGTVDVDLEAVSDDAFRFFENHRFVFVANTEKR